MSNHTEWDGLSGCLDPVFSLLHTALHAVVSDLGKLSALIDVHTTAVTPLLDRDQVVSVARRHSLVLSTVAAVGRSHRWLGTPRLPGMTRQTVISPWLWISAATST